MTKIYTKGGDKGQTGLFSGERVSKNNPLINALGTVDELNSSLGVARSYLDMHHQRAERHLEEWKNYLAKLEQTKENPNAKAHFDEPSYLEAVEHVARLEQWSASRTTLLEILHTIQLELFELGAELASGTPGIGRINDAQIERFERWIDELTAGLPPLRNFILPTGHPVAAHLHQARTVSRRAERMVVAAIEVTRQQVGQDSAPVQDSESAGTEQSSPNIEQARSPVPPVQIDPVVVRYLNRLNDLLFVLAREGNRVFGVSDEEWHSPKSA